MQGHASRKIAYVPIFAESLRFSLFSAKPLEPWKQKLSLFCLFLEWMFAFKFPFTSLPSKNVTF